MVLKLSKAGYGTPMELLQMNSEIILTAIEYESFIQDFEEAFLALNKDSK